MASLGIRNRIIVTERGQELQRSLQEDVRMDAVLVKRQHDEDLHRSKSSIDESSRLLSQAFGTSSSLRMMESVGKKLQVVMSSGKLAPQKIVDMFVEENNISRKEISPYMLQKITKMTEEVCKDRRSSKALLLAAASQSMNSNSILNANDVSAIHRVPPNATVPSRFSQNDSAVMQPRQLSANAGVTIGQSQFISDNIQHNSMVSNVSSMNYTDDNFLVEKCNAILNCEARVDRIMKRYKVYQHQTKQIEAKVRRAYEARSEQLQQENLRPPKLLSELREDNDDEIANILKRSDKHEQHHQARILETMKDKYQKVWRRIHVPELTHKHKTLHQLSHPYSKIDEQSEEEDRKRPEESLRL